MRATPFESMKENSEWITAAHWVNTLSLNTDFVLRTGATDHTGRAPEDLQECKKKALERYNVRLALHFSSPIAFTLS